MELKEYFESVEGAGILATADSLGKKREMMKHTVFGTSRETGNNEQPGRISPWHTDRMVREQPSRSSTGVRSSFAK